MNTAKLSRQSHIPTNINFTVEHRTYFDLQRWYGSSQIDVSTAYNIPPSPNQVPTLTFLPRHPSCTPSYPAATRNLYRRLFNYENTACWLPINSWLHVTELIGQLWSITPGIYHYPIPPLIMIYPLILNTPHYTLTTPGHHGNPSKGIKSIINHY